MEPTRKNTRLDVKIGSISTLVVAILACAGCDGGAAAKPTATEVPVASTSAPSTSTVVTTSVPKAAVTPNHPPQLATGTSWIGEPVDPSVALAEAVTIDATARDGTSVHAAPPVDWAVVVVGDDLRDEHPDPRGAHLFVSPEKTAVVIVAPSDAASTDASVVHVVTERFLGVSGGASAMAWDARPSRTEPPRIFRGTAKLTGEAAETWEVMVLREGAARPMVVGAALGHRAPARRRSELLACLGSIAVVR